jgi:hypothetical protein
VFFADSELITCNLAGFARYTIRSEPTGTVFQSAFAPPGTVVATPDYAANASFGYWSVGDVRQQDAWGVAVTGVSFTLGSNDVEVVAHFYAGDTDADGVPDAYEQKYLGTLVHGAGHDPDGDGLGLLAEFQGGTLPHFGEFSTPGGIFYADSELVTVNLAGFASYRLSSQPAGQVNQFAVVPEGTVVTSPDLSDPSFGFWTLDDVRQQDAWGIALRQIQFTVTNTDREAVAHFFAGDSDGDGIPDGVEWYNYGGLATPASADTDGDGLTLAQEVAGGTSPVFGNSSTPGGVFWADSELITVDLQHFDRVESVLIGGQMTRFFSFFATDPTGEDLGEESRPALGDWDGDGDLDLVVGLSNGVWRVYENAGAPLIPDWWDRTVSFQPLASMAAGAGRVAPALGDWTGDGRADLAVGGDTGSIAFTPAGGTFAGPSSSGAGTLETGVARTLPAFGHLNVDGLADLLVWVPEGQVRLYPNTGTGPVPFSTHTADLLGTPVPNATGLAAVDTDEDGDNDVLVADDEGRIWFFRNDGPAGFRLLNKIYGGTRSGFARNLSIAAGDVDGDGDPDVLGGFAEGGLVYLRNPAARLEISPPSYTLLTEGTLGYTARNGTGVNWRLLHNRSGASLDPTGGQYQAGALGGQVDVIEGLSAEGLRGLAYVNVIRASDVTAVGKSILVAGGRSLDDPVWEATDFLAGFAYSALRYRGFSRDNLQYLSFGPNQDVDGNGLLDDIDGPCTLAALASTFTGWVTQGAPPERLFLYLTDHGSDSGGAGRMRLNASEFLTATQLDAWLDALQDTHGMDVTVVLDFCYAGSFLDELTYGGTAKRMVLSAANADELTYFIAGGQVSFSSVFFAGIYQGLHVEDSFLQAREAVSYYQTAELDEDGNGAYEPGVDGPLARTRRVGASFLVGRDFPLIGSVTPVTTLVTEDRVRIWAADISSAYPLQRVHATVVAPGFNPNPDSGVPVLTLPEVELQWDPLTRRYEAELTGLTQPGAYLVQFQARDIWGGLSLPRQTVVNQAGFDERCLLVLAGADAADVAAHTNATARLYGALKRRSFTDDRIQLLAPLPLDIDGDGTNETDTVVSEAGVLAAITDWAASADRLHVHVLGRGDSDGLNLPANTRLSVSALDAALDGFQSANRPLNVILDFDACGAWLPSLTAPPGRERVLIASTQSARPALANSVLGYTGFFAQALLHGYSLGDAHDLARQLVRRLGNNVRQSALLDDNGDGIPNEKGVDGRIAALRHLGAAFLTGEDNPVIGRVISPTNLVQATHALLWADDVSDAGGVQAVWVDITAPTNWVGAVSERLDLAYNESRGRWEADYSRFLLPGAYNLAFQALDTEFNLSDVALSQVFVDEIASITRTQPQLPDPYEADADCETAPLADLPVNRVHSLHLSTDADAVRFFAESAFVYDIETVHLTNTIDTVIEVHRLLPDGSSELVDRVDEFGADDGELTGLNFPPQGIYCVRVTHADGTPFSAGAYRLVIHVPAGFTGINVTARNLITQGAIAGAFARLYDAAGVLLESAPLDAAGVVKFTRAIGNYRVEVPPPPGFVALFDPNNQSNVPENPDSTYGNARNLSTGNFGTVTYGAGAGGSAAYLGFYFLPGVTITGSVVDAVTREPLEGVEVIARRNQDQTLYDRFPWALYGTPWQTAAGAFPARFILPPGADYTLNLGRPDYNSASVALPSPSTGPISLGRLTLVAVDSDGDGLPDAWEQAHFGNLGQNAQDNADGDAFSNAEEFRSATHPKQAASFFRVEDVGASADLVTFRWPASAARRYRIQGAPTPGGPWSLVADLNPPIVIAGKAEWSGPASTGQRYFRIEVLFMD